MKQLYARFMHPESGYAWDVEHTRRTTLKVGRRYLLEAFLPGPIFTDIWIKGVDFPLNASHFQIESATGESVALSSS